MPAHPAPPVRPDEPTQPAAGSRISVDRVIPGIAATVLLTSIALVALVGPWWLLLTGFVAVNLALYSAVGWCPVSLLLTKLGIRRYPACTVDPR